MKFKSLIATGLACLTAFAASAANVMNSGWTTTTNPSTALTALGGVTGPQASAIAKLSITNLNGSNVIQAGTIGTNQLSHSAYNFLVTNAPGTVGSNAFDATAVLFIQNANTNAGQATNVIVAPADTSIKINTNSSANWSFQLNPGGTMPAMNAAALTNVTGIWATNGNPETPGQKDYSLAFPSGDDFATIAQLVHKTDSQKVYYLGDATFNAMGITLMGTASGNMYSNAGTGMRFAINDDSGTYVWRVRETNIVDVNENNFVAHDNANHWVFGNATSSTTLKGTNITAEGSATVNTSLYTGSGSASGTNYFWTSDGAAYTPYLAWADSLGGFFMNGDLTLGALTASGVITGNLGSATNLPYSGLAGTGGGTGKYYKWGGTWDTPAGSGTGTMSNGFYLPYFGYELVVTNGAAGGNSESAVLYSGVSGDHASSLYLSSKDNPRITAQQSTLTKTGYIEWDGTNWTGKFAGDGAGLTNITAAQTPWTGDIDGNSKSLTNAGAITVNMGAANAYAYIARSSGAGLGSGMVLSNTSASGKAYNIYSDNAGAFHIGDATAAADRIKIATGGAVSVGSGSSLTLDSGAFTVNNGLSTFNGSAIVSNQLSAAGITNTGVLGAASLATDANGKIIAGSAGLTNADQTFFNDYVFAGAVTVNATALTFASFADSMTNLLQSVVPGSYFRFGPYPLQGIFTGSGNVLTNENGVAMSDMPGKSVNNTFTKTNTFTGDVYLGGSSNYLGAATFSDVSITNLTVNGPTTFTTNLCNGIPNFTNSYSLFTTNDVAVFGLPIGQIAAKAQTAVVFVKNTGATWTNITAPANVQKQGTWNVTNLTSVTFFNYAGVFTNAVALPLY